MCGRYTESRPLSEILERFQADPDQLQLDLQPRYNLAPTQPAPIVREVNGHRQLSLLQWGLVPSWSKDTAIGSRLINARVETVGEKPSFRAAYRKRHCLVVADGFYEWQRLESGKQPWRFTLKDGGLFAFAGLWEHWQQDGQTLETFTILTTDANDLVGRVHNRMPVILHPDQEAPWLALEKTDLSPLPADSMAGYPVSRAVNNPRNDSAELVVPLQEDRGV